jgi:hypothetical protein
MNGTYVLSQKILSDKVLERRISGGKKRGYGIEPQIFLPAFHGGITLCARGRTDRASAVTGYAELCPLFTFAKPLQFQDLRR